MYIKKFLFWLFHVVLINDVKCGGYCPTCEHWRICHDDIACDF